MNKLRKITFRDHPILGNLNLDFCDENGKAVDTVIFAGENGSGKSTILNCLYQISSSTVNFCAEIEMENDAGIRNMLYFQHQNGGYYFRENVVGVIRDIPVAASNRVDYFKVNPIYGIFSDVDINFHTGEITAVTSENIDMKKNSRRSDLNLTKQINQLLIDVQALDDADVSKIFRSARDAGEDTNRLVISERMSRFKNAFAKIFDNLTYDRIENQNGHKSIIFKKNNAEIPIESLSSGEKQIVYRGCFLLKDANALNGAFVFIDEPEISLHPNWQKKIMDYYKGIFTDENGNQTSQIFAVTHSPFIIHNENRRNDKVIVIERDSQGKIVVKDKPEYYKCDSLELVHDAFLIKDFSLGQPTVYLEGRTDEKYFTKALEVFRYSNIPFRFKWIGYIDDNEQERFTGCKALNQAFDFLVSKNLPYKNVLLYDCDTNRSVSEKNNVVIGVISEYQNSKKMKKGIENALVLDDIDTTPFYKEKIKEGDYGDDWSGREFQKMDFCNYICSLDDTTLKTVFTNLNTEIQQLLKLFGAAEK